MGMDDTIIQILLPMHDEEEVKDGEKKGCIEKSVPRIPFDPDGSQ